MKKFGEAYKKGHLKGLLEQEKGKLKQIKAGYPLLPIGLAASTTISSIGAANCDYGSGFLLIFSGILGVSTLTTWYLGHRALKICNKNISNLEKKLECL